MTLSCPVDDCAETWPDTYGAGGGRRRRFIHVHDDHDLRRLPHLLLLDHND